MTASTRAAAMIGARMDRLPMTRAQLGMFVLLAIFSVFELGDLNTFAYATPGLIKTWGLTVPVIGQITSLTFLGLFLGAWLGGYLADRWGRRILLIATIAWFSVFSLLNAVVQTPGQLEVTRFLTGMGLGSEIINTWTYMGEMFPKTHRGRYQSLIFALGLIGIPLMAWWARTVVPTGPDGWRFVFVAGAIGLLTLPFIGANIPESPRWLDTKGRHDEADQVLKRIEARIEAMTGRRLPEPVPEAVGETVAAVPVGELFQQRLIRRTVVVTLGMMASILGFYGFSAWVPTLLVKSGYTELQSLTYTSIISLGAPVGAILAWPVTDRFGRRAMVGVVAFAIALFVLLYGMKFSVAAVLVFGFLVALFLQTQTTLFYAYAAEVFPTHVRSTGWGFANGMGRLANVAGGVLVAAIYGGLGYMAVFVFVALMFVVEGLVVLVWGEQTAKRSLEEINAAAAAPSG